MTENSQINTQNETNDLNDSLHNTTRNFPNRETQLMNILNNTNQNSGNPSLRNLQIQRGPNYSSFTFNKETFRYLLNTHMCFLFSLVINVILLFAILFLFFTSDNQTISLEKLEDDDMLTIYVLFFLFSFISVWNCFLFISLIIFKINFIEIKFDDIKKFNSSTLTIEILYFNPAIYCFAIYNFYKHLFPTNLDLLIWHLISSFYFINFIFTTKLYFYSKLKVKYIANKILMNNTSHKLSVNRVRANQILLIFFNFIYVYFIAECIKETNFIHKYLLVGKGIYLLSKQIEFFILNEIKFTKLNYFHPNRKEEKFLKNLSIKSKIRLVNLIFIIHKLILANYLLFSANYRIYYFFPLILFYVNMTVSLISEFRSYERVKKFYLEIDKFPIIEYEKDSNEECIICTENFIKARRLPCGHHFHFFCIAKWLKKNPSKICPICRRDIFMNDNVNVNSMGNNLIPRSYGFRLESRFFSWLPDISLRIFRGQSAASILNRNPNLNFQNLRNGVGNIINFANVGNVNNFANSFNPTDIQNSPNGSNTRNFINNNNNDDGINNRLDNIDNINNLNLNHDINPVDNNNH